MGFFKALFENREDNFNRVKNSFEQERNLTLLDNILIKEISGLEVQTLTTINLFEDRLRLCGIGSLAKNDIKETRNIFRQDIKKIRIMDTRQIEEQSKLGQMMIIGVLALGTKKQTKEILERRIVLDLCEDGIDFSVALNTNDARYDILTLAKKLNKWRESGAWERIS